MLSLVFKKDTRENKSLLPTLTKKRQAFSMLNMAISSSFQ